jgi:hypothetical protein
MNSAAAALDGRDLPASSILGRAVEKPLQTGAPGDVSTCKLALQVTKVPVATGGWLKTLRTAELEREWGRNGACVYDGDIP